MFRKGLLLIFSPSLAPPRSILLPCPHILGSQLFFNPSIQVMVMYSWMCGHFMESGPPIRSHTLKETLSVSSPTPCFISSKTPQLRVELHAHLSPWLAFVRSCAHCHSCCEFICIAVSGGLANPVSYSSLPPQSLTIYPFFWNNCQALKGGLCCGCLISGWALYSHFGSAFWPVGGLCANGYLLQKTKTKTKTKAPMRVERCTNL